MRYLRIDEQFPTLSGCAVTLGKFDGVHRGHQHLVKAVTECRRSADLQAVLVSFTTGNPGILSSGERRSLLEKMGVDLMLECPLEPRIMGMEPEQFVKKILAWRLRARMVAVGEDFRFGHMRRGTPEMLSMLGKTCDFDTRIVPDEMDGERKISSTYIRNELESGNMEKANELLGYSFFLDGTVIHGRGLGHRQLLPTINMEPPADKLMPPNGVYITRTTFSDGTKYEGITNIGLKPTVGGDVPGAETYLFDCSRDLYGMEARVEFLHYRRPEQRFSSLEALREQLYADAEAGKAYFC